jgi:hypothetical protein
MRRQRFYKFLRLFSADRWLAVHAVMTLVIGRLALASVRFTHKTMPLQTARKIVSFAERILPAPTSIAPAEHIAWAVHAVW